MESDKCHFGLELGLGSHRVTMYAKKQAIAQHAGQWSVFNVGPNSYDKLFLHFS